LTPSFWWLDAMLLVWLLFTVLLFIAEPLFVHRWLAARALRMPEATLALIQRLHWALLALSLLAVFGGVFGAHGLSLFG
jgi:hypothetical protein